MRDAFVAVMGGVVAAIHRETDGKLAALASKIARLEAAMEQFRYCGAWQESQE